MPGGNPDAWPLVKPILRTIAAKVADGSPCCEWVGPDGAGHYVKMVHNGIEYGDMQMISEAYAIMRGALEMSAGDIADVFDEWNRGELDSYLIEITREVLRKTDPETGKPMVDIILDAAGQKGTGKWTSQNALDIGAPTPTVAEAVFARCVSALKEERVAASKTLRGPATSFGGNRSEFLADIGKALYASKICSYAQGFQLLEMAGREYGWDLRHGDIALMWRGGCIIRAKFLGDIKKAFDDDPKLPNLLLAPFFKNAIDEAQDSWRNVVASAARMGIPAPAFASALAYYDSYRSERLPANLIQAQRDYFGAHTYERIDRPRGEFFHTDWSRD
jgi:6-phosphogluconate dehydrogenase